ncbi:MAG: hypothetical protein ACO1OD_10325 [Croceibacterium sp.]
MTRAIHHTANWCLGASVWLCAALVFPLQLGWAGAPVIGLLAYIAIAGGLLLAADILHDPLSYRGKGTVRAQASPFLMAVALPAALAFLLGQVLAPLDQAVEEEDVCGLAGLAPTVEGSMQEFDDGFDPTADCARASDG